MLWALILILAAIAVLPLVVRKVEENIEVFILAMGIAAAAVAGELNLQQLSTIFSDVYLYATTLAVLLFSLAFMLLDERIAKAAERIFCKVRVRTAVFVLITGIGLISCVITSVIAGLLAAELVALLPLERRRVIRINILTCFSIGIGSILTPLGGPLSVIVASGLKVGFGYLFIHLWPFVLTALLLFGALGALIAHKGGDVCAEHARLVLEKHSLKTVGARAMRIFLFIIGLEMLGMAVRPAVEQYVLRSGAGPLYALNMLSAVLDNATMAAAEINPMLHMGQLLAILLSLTISGGMMITGNIPNIITAGRLKIGMKEWLKVGLPVGAAVLALYYAIICLLSL